MHGIVFQSNDRPAQPAAGHDFVPGLQFTQHLLPLLLPSLLRHDQQEVEDGENEDQGRESQETRRPSAKLQRYKYCIFIRIRLPSPAGNGN